MKLYETLADTIRRQIQEGVMLPGEKIPSVRRASQQYHLSISTVIRAFLLLESQGLIESRPQSGYFVRLRQAAACPPGPVPVPARPPCLPVPPADATPAALVLHNLRSINCTARIPLGSPYPDPALFPSARITQLAQGFYKRREQRELIGTLPPGNLDLIRQIARRHLETGLPVQAGEIIITQGATEALQLCLQAIARPGAAIAVESPTYYALLHAIERAGMRALPIPTDPGQGIDLPSLDRALASGEVAGAVVMSNFQNPLGFLMPDSRKQALVRLMASYQLPLVENDVYGELHYSDQRPRPAKSYDEQGLVLYCSSFSKSLTPEQHIGWTMPGRYRQAVEQLKFLNTVSMPTHPQRAVAEYLQNEGYDFHLRRLRKLLMQRERIMRSAVLRFFPAGTHCSQPQGGYLLWVSLPRSVRAIELHARAQEAGISVAPGDMFSSDPAFHHCIRLNYSFPWERDVEAAVRTLGELCHDMVASARDAERDVQAGLSPMTFQPPATGLISAR